MAEKKTVEEISIDNHPMLFRIGVPAMLEQLAEESSELTQAALKFARVIRGENPTPVTQEEAAKHLLEEYTDVLQCALELELSPIKGQMELKLLRFLERWEDAKE